MTKVERILQINSSKADIKTNEDNGLNSLYSIDAMEFEINDNTT